MDHAFDFSDVPFADADSLDDVLAIAAEVLAEYGEQPTRNRIVRMAEWLILNVGGEPHMAEVMREGCVKYRGDQEHPHATLVRVGGLVAVEDKDGQHHAIAVGSEGGRAFAVAILRAVEGMD